jgi:hypothetical protein
MKAPAAKLKGVQYNLFEPIPPVKPGRIPKDARCQEASVFSREKYIPCGAPATTVVSHDRDGREYYMCLPCAGHNVRNRGARFVRGAKP